MARGAQQGGERVDPIAILTAQDLESIFEPESEPQKFARRYREVRRVLSTGPHSLIFAERWAQGRLLVRERGQK